MNFWARGYFVSTVGANEDLSVLKGGSIAVEVFHRPPYPTSTV
jgi:REP element-mobilizing transposase RayT